MVEATVVMGLVLVEKIVGKLVEMVGVRIGRVLNGGAAAVATAAATSGSMISYNATGVNVLVVDAVTRNGFRDVHDRTGAMVLQMAPAPHLLGQRDKGGQIGRALRRDLELVPLGALGNDRKQHVKDANGPGDRVCDRVSRPLQEVADQGKVEVGLEAETHGVVELLEVPLQGFPGLHHHLLQTLHTITMMT